MSYHRGVARDEYGNSLSGASVTIYDAGTTTASTLYSEETLVTSEDNPFETGTDGVYEFWADPGLYDIQIAKAGFSTTTISNMQVGIVFANIESSATAGVRSGTVAGTGAVQWIDTSLGAFEYGVNYAQSFELDGTHLLQYTGGPTSWFLVTGIVNASISVPEDFQITLARTGSSSDSLILATGKTSTNDEGINLVVTTAVELVTSDKLLLSFGLASANIATSNVSITATSIS